MWKKQTEKVRNFLARSIVKIRKQREEKKKKEHNKDKKYGQIKRKHSLRGIRSCIIAGGVFFLLAILFYVAFAFKGKAAAVIGSFGIMALIFSWIGFMLLVGWEWF